jgi:hypothetical protein
MHMLHSAEKFESEYDTMSTLDLLRAYHKTTGRLNDIRSSEEVPRTHERDKIEGMGETWDKLIQTKRELEEALTKQGARFIKGNFDLTTSSDEIKKLVEENGPE